jgi:hypothetical protein
MYYRSTQAKWPHSDALRGAEVDVPEGWISGGGEYGVGSRFLLAAPTLLPLNDGANATSESNTTAVVSFAGLSDLPYRDNITLVECIKSYFTAFHLDIRSACIIKNRDTQPTGCALVEFTSVDHYEVALKLDLVGGDGALRLRFISPSSEIVGKFHISAFLSPVGLDDSTPPTVSKELIRQFFANGKNPPYVALREVIMVPLYDKAGQIVSVDALVVCESERSFTRMMTKFLDKSIVPGGPVFVALLIEAFHESRNPHSREKTATKRQEQRDNDRRTSPLPIYSKKREICERLRNEKILIVTAETGSGKTTQIPQYCAEEFGGVVACTQPRVMAGCYFNWKEGSI